MFIRSAVMEDQKLIRPHTPFVYAKQDYMVIRTPKKGDNLRNY